MSAPAFSLSDVTFRYPGAEHPALDRMSLEIPQGAAMALLGPNGAGKSTLMDLLLRWKKPQSGRILLNGRPLAAYSPRQLSQCMALVPQEEQSQFTFTVADYVLFGRAPHLAVFSVPGSDDAALVRDTLAEVGLADFAQRPVTTLSGGEHQLLLVARAMVQQTDILLLDEPTSALDPANTARIVGILKKLHAQGRTLLFTTHDPSLAAELASHVALIQNGDLLAAGTTADVMTPALLTRLYGIPIHTLQHGGRMLVFRADDTAGPY